MPFLPVGGLFLLRFERSPPPSSSPSSSSSSSPSDSDSSPSTCIRPLRGAPDGSSVPSSLVGE